MQAPTLRDVYEAKKTIAPYLPRPPLHFSPGLSDFLDAQVYLKHDEYLPLGAFKARGGVNLLAHLSEEERGRGVITASTGNHGQSIAYACGLFGARAVIELPEEANPVKVAAMHALGAELIFHGRNFDEAKDYCERLAAEEGYRYAHPANEPLLIAEVAMLWWIDAHGQTGLAHGAFIVGLALGGFKRWVTSAYFAAALVGGKPMLASQPTPHGHALVGPAIALEPRCVA